MVSAIDLVDQCNHSEPPIAAASVPCSKPPPDDQRLSAQSSACKQRRRWVLCTVAGHSVLIRLARGRSSHAAGYHRHVAAEHVVQMPEDAAYGICCWCDFCFSLIPPAR